MKLAQVGYGSKGQGAKPDGSGYIYLVNDNVKVEQTIYPAVKHHISHKIFGTTGKVLNLDGKATGEKKQDIVDNLNKQVEEFNAGKKPEEQEKEKYNGLLTYQTGKEAGLERTRTEKGTFASDKGTYDKDGNYQATERAYAIRGANIASAQAITGHTHSDTFKANKAVETYASYTKMNGGK